MSPDAIPNDTAAPLSEFLFDTCKVATPSYSAVASPTLSLI